MQKKLRTLIVEDKFDEREDLKIWLSPHFDIIDIVAEARSVEEAVRILSKDSFNLTILDIGLDDGTGYDLFEIVDDRKRFGIVVMNTTAENCDIRKNPLVGYPLWLPKPYSTKGTNKFIYDLKSRINETSLELHSYDILQANRNRKILWDDQILFLEGVKGNTNYYFIDTVKGWSFITTNPSIGEEEKRLNAGRFQRCHDSYIVNVRSIAHFVREKKGGLLKFDVPGLKDIPYSNTYANELFRKMNLS